ncbi:MAG: hypothetical protein ACOYOU_10700 [Kiritimatiellia bacterium]
MTVCAGEPTATHVPTNAGAAAWRFRVGPFFEVGRSREGVDVLAVRPLYSRVAETNTHESLTDVVWPWGSFHRRDDYFHWWAFPAFGKDENVSDPFSRHTFWLLPFYVNGRTREGEDFEALFPVGGTVRDFFGIDELRFILFPVYLDYRKGEQQTESYLWPVYLRETGPTRDRFRLFPVYGTSTTSTERASFAFWPFWTREVFDGPKQHGVAEMLFPLYGRVNTDTQRGWMVLPPFFSRMTMTNGESSLRAPWPFYETSHQKSSDKHNLWPLWTHTETPTGHRGTIAWPLWWEDESGVSGRREQRETLVPFYHAARSVIRTGDRDVLDMDYVRVWPLYSRYEQSGESRIRVPELTFMRDGQGIERNWAPFWSWYVQNEGQGAIDHDLFWGLARWGRQCDHTHYMQLGPLVAWKRPPGGRLEWNVLGGLCAREMGGAKVRHRWFWFWCSGDSAETGVQRR